MFGYPFESLRNILCSGELCQSEVWEIWLSIGPIGSGSIIVKMPDEPYQEFKEP